MSGSPLSGAILSCEAGYSRSAEGAEAILSICVCQLSFVDVFLLETHD